MGHHKEKNAPKNSKPEDGIVKYVYNLKPILTVENSRNLICPPHKPNF